MKLAVSLLAAILIIGCAAHVQHPGTANAFDSDTFDTLLISNNVIESTKTAYLKGTFPASAMPAIKDALNGLIQAYDVADSLYLNYHAAVATSAGATAQQIADLKTALNNVNSATATLVSAKGAQ